MSSTNKTSLGLNLWEASDKPVRQDFVNDNTIIDEKITNIKSSLDNVNSNLDNVNINLAMRGKFAIRDTSITLPNTGVTIPMTRVIENPNNFYTVNGDGTITVPPGTYIITASMHGIQVANQVLNLSMTCTGNMTACNDNWTISEQFYKELTLNAKNTVSMTLKISGSSSGGTCSIFGYLEAIDTTVTIQKIT